MGEQESWGPEICTVGMDMIKSIRKLRVSAVFHSWNTVKPKVTEIEFIRSTPAQSLMKPLRHVIF